MLAAMFGDRGHTPSFDTQGNYFIDRDPQFFGCVLNYLRTQRLIVTDHIPLTGILEVRGERGERGERGVRTRARMCVQWASPFPSACVPGVGN